VGGRGTAAGAGVRPEEGESRTDAKRPPGSDQPPGPDGAKAAREPAAAGPDPGLCGDCVHARVIESKRGSRFYLCELAAVDVRFSKYPRLPVVRCGGYRRAPAAPVHQ
jgi:hypothetical protein